MRMTGLSLSLVLLVAACFSLATYLEPRSYGLTAQGGQPFSLIETLMGDSRRLFATHFLLKADAYFHSGFYPGIFDSAQSFHESELVEEQASSGLDSPEKSMKEGSPPSS